MRRSAALVGTFLLLIVAACAQPGQQTRPGSPTGSPDQRREAFEQRATEVADAWRAAPGREAWDKGYVPLQDPTVLPADPGFDNDTKHAFQAGWYRAEVPLPANRPADGTINFPGGTLRVPLISAEQAYRQLDQGDPPPCPAGRPTAPATSPSGPDNAVSSVPTTCVVLTVTRASLGAVKVRTSRGEAQVPAWVFTVAELAGPVARLAVAPPAVGAPPTVPSPTRPPAAGLVAAQDLTGIDGAKLTYRLGVGACDTDVTPLVQQHGDVVVVAGTVTPPTGPCTAQLVLAPVSVTLDAPLGARPVLNAITGQPLTLIPSR